MPTYTFRNKETGEVFDQFMKIGEREYFLTTNPNLEVVIGTPVVIDPTRLGTLKHDAGFKEVLQKIHEKTPGSVLDRTTNI